MPRYLLTYHGEMSMEDMPSDPDAIQAVMAEWGAWFQSMGDALVDEGAPISVSTALAEGGATSAAASLTGYTVINAADMVAASKIAEGSPVLGNGHVVQISECIEM